MTNAQIIFNNRVFLMEQGIIKGIPGTSITIEDEDGKRTIQMPEEIRSYDDWKREGRQVQKEEHSVARFQIWMPKKGKAKAEKENSENEQEEEKLKGFYKKVVFFFTIDQTKEIEG